MRTFHRSFLAGAFALGLAAAECASAQFTNTYFFGDSLTDNGSFIPVLPAGTGRFTTNPGPVWAQFFAQNYGFNATPANQGGTDYAEGGARVSLLPGVPNSPPTATATPVTTQVARLLAKGPIDPNATYSFFAGANDLFTQLTLAQAGVISSAQAQANLVTAASDLVTAIATLRAAGAKYIIVWNLPDIGKTPFGVSTGPAGAAQITALAGLYNGALLSGLDTAGVRAIRLDSFRLINEVIANPALYGFANATSPACGATISALCTAANLVAPNAAQTYVFADGVHPTTAAHKLIAQFALSAIIAPQQIAVLAEAPLAVEQANFRTLDSRMISAINAPRGAGKLEAWAAYDYGNPDFNGGFFSGDSHVHTIAVGADMKISEHLLAGLQFGYSENRGDSGIANYKLNEPMGTLYLGYGAGPWYVAGTLGAGGLDFRTNRNIELGAATRTESAETRGWQVVGRVMGGYWFYTGDWVHGPAVRLTFQDVRVDAFQERGSDSTTMAFGEQRRQSFVASAGWQASGQIAGFRPYGRASWEHEARGGLRSMTASTILGGTFSVPAYKPDSNYALFNAGVSKEFGNVTGFIVGSGTAAKSDGNSYGITVGLRTPL